MAPTGTVTFLFTDIEGSTQLWDQHGDQMSSALERHDSIVRSHIEKHRGYVFSTAGDSFAAAFDRVDQAMAAAVSSQEELGSEPWPVDAEIRVRMGLHTGEALEREGDYFGATLNRAARIMASGHGGQIVVSSATAELMESPLLVDLGTHRLKDLRGPQRLFQLGTDTFPPLRTLDTTRHNLPVLRTALLGRDDLVDRVRRHLVSSRLVSLTGIGGAGKTKLAVCVGADAVEEFPDGVFFVDLASINDGGLVLAVAAEATGLEILATQRELGSVLSAISRRRMLLIVDNCEHVIDGAADFVDQILSVEGECRILATSREPLDLDGEVVVRVGPLAPDSAVELLVERTRIFSPDFQPNQEDDRILRQVCEQLDGLPLAIELAAAQLAILTPIELLDRLDNRFELLTGSRRGRRQGQQTLNAMMDWSWKLLTEPEQEVAMRLAVFVGSWRLEAAEALCAHLGGQAVEVVRSLTARSLIDRSDGPSGARFRYPETVRIFACQKLADSGFAGQARESHRRLLLDWLRRYSADYRLASFEFGLDWYEQIPDIRMAVGSFLDSGQRDDAIDLVLGGLNCFRHGIALGDGRRWLQALGGAREAEPDLVQLEAELQVGAGYQSASETWDRWMAIREGGSRELEPWGLCSAGIMKMDENLLDAGLSLARELDAEQVQSLIFAEKAKLSLLRGEIRRASDLAEHALKLGLPRTIGTKEGLGTKIELALIRGDFDEAERLNTVWGAGLMLGENVAAYHDHLSEAIIASHRGDRSETVRKLRDFVAALDEIEGTTGHSEALLVLAQLALCENDYETANRFLSAKLRRGYGNITSICWRRRLIDQVRSATIDRQPSFDADVLLRSAIA